MAWFFKRGLTLTVRFIWAVHLIDGEPNRRTIGELSQDARGGFIEIPVETNEDGFFLNHFEVLREDSMLGRGSEHYFCAAGVSPNSLIA